MYKHLLNRKYIHEMTEEELGRIPMMVQRGELTPIKEVRLIKLCLERDVFLEPFNNDYMVTGDNLTNEICDEIRTLIGAANHNI